MNESQAWDSYVEACKRSGIDPGPKRDLVTLTDDKKQNVDYLNPIKLEEDTMPRPETAAVEADENDIIPSTIEEMPDGPYLGQRIEEADEESFISEESDGSDTTDEETIYFDDLPDSYIVHISKGKLTRLYHKIREEAMAEAAEAFADSVNMFSPEELINCLKGAS